MPDLSRLDHAKWPASYKQLQQIRPGVDNGLPILCAVVQFGMWILCLSKLETNTHSFPQFLLRCLLFDRWHSQA